jgi:tetratricopeptide (TPR) repeat protein
LRRCAYARGLEFEHLASVGNFAGRSIDIADRRRGALVGAAAGFERAVRADPEFHAAFLHLGRVRMLQDVEAEAAKALEVAARAHDPAVAYLAKLFAGSLAERAGRFEEAEAQYRAAVSVYPSGQKGLMALGQLLGRTSREAEARQLLEAALRDGRSRSVDPYWTYLVPPRIGLGQVAAWLDELGVEARR